MTPEAIKSRMLSTTGSDCRSRTFVVLSLLIQLSLVSDVQAADDDTLRYPLKQTFTGARSNDCFVVKVKKNTKTAETIHTTYVQLKFYHIQRLIISLTKFDTRTHNCCTGCRCVGGSSVQAVLPHALSLLREVPGLSRQRHESRRMRSSMSRSSILVVVGFLSAPVAHQVRQVCLHVCWPVCVELTAEGPTCCHRSWTFYKTTQE